MSPKSETERSAAGPWSLAVRLTAYYASSAFLIVALATGYLYWAMVRNVDLEDDRTLADKIRLLQSILHAAPLDVPAIQQEANESWQASQQTVVFIRVIARGGRLIAESPEMAALLPVDLFPAPANELGRGSNVETKSRRSYRLLSVGNADGIVQVATDRTLEQEILAGYEESLWT